MDACLRTPPEPATSNSRVPTLASPEGNSTAQDWHNVAERIAHVNEEGTWVNWTKRPKDTGIREWYVHGKQEEMLRTLLESGANAQTVWREQ